MHKLIKELQDEQKKQKISGSDLARLSQVNRTSIHRMLKHPKYEPSIIFVEKIAKALGLTLTLTKIK